ncbi:MAG: DNA primase [Candidatus Omnitrophica bacterium]|nr:DNA primase [Candidatus Omnitrophota bacterium]
MGHIPENIIDDILNRVDIVEVISDYIPLKRAGRNFRALCPFHHEKSPSFMVSPDRQIYHCFGCGAGGNVFGFLIQYERLEFREAVEALAKKAGVAIPQQFRRDSPEAGVVSALHAVNELAAKFYENILGSPKGTAAREYLFTRGLTEDSIRSFRIGFAADAWNALITHLRNKNISLAVLEKAGLILSREGGGGYYDRFRNRIIIPVFDIKSKIIAFGARVMPGTGDRNPAKYVNSPETPVYVKRNCLYGLHLAKDAIRDLDFVIVVEGYLDFIIPCQHGVRNIVASSGTSLTQEQARIIKRFTHNVVVVYDGDSAGQMAAVRSLDIFVEEGMQVKVASLPEGYDPDSFVREKGIEAFKILISRAATLFDYKLAILESRFSSRSIEDKARISSEMLGTIGKFSNSILKSEYLKKLGDSLGIDVDSLHAELKKIKGDRPYAEVQPVPAKARAVNPTEQLLMKLMLEESSLVDGIRRRIEPSDFQDERISRIVTALFDFLDHGREVEPSILINHFGDTEIAGLICESAFTHDTEQGNKKEIVDDCIRRLKSKKKDSRKRFLHEEIKNAQKSGNEEKLHQLMREFHALIKEGVV